VSARAYNSGARREARVGSLVLKNAVMTAAGTAGHGAELAEYFDLSLLGAHVVKSLAVFPYAGNPAPRLAPVRGGMLNSVGLQGRGVAAWLEEELPALEQSGASVVASIWGRRVEDFEAAALLFAHAPSCVVALEVNVSCPNVEDRQKMFAHSASATEEVLAATAPCRRPRWAKLSPNVTDVTEIAAAALRGGAEAVTLVNTLIGLDLDLASRRPVLGAGGGGLSGPALGAVALRAVSECAAALPQATIIGVGGISSGADAAKFLLAGASAVQVGTATLVRPRAALRVLRELEAWLDREGIGELDEVIGALHG
jgi:dihydroorotate dehydrogenase (NAD+) catalytic subunit